MAATRVTEVGIYDDSNERSINGTRRQNPRNGSSAWGRSTARQGKRQISPIALMHITLEHGGEGLTYLDEHENPLRYLLHWGVEAAMKQAQIEYGVTPHEWEAVRERLPWKSTDTPKRLKVTHKRPRGR